MSFDVVNLFINMNFVWSAVLGVCECECLVPLTVSVCLCFKTTRRIVEWVSAWNLMMPFAQNQMPPRDYIGQQCAIHHSTWIHITYVLNTVWNCQTVSISFSHDLIVISNDGFWTDKVEAATGAYRFCLFVAHNQKLNVYQTNQKCMNEQYSFKLANISNEFQLVDIVVKNYTLRTSCVTVHILNPCKFECFGFNAILMMVIVKVENYMTFSYEKWI